jgi:hypothetical protein
MGVLGKIGGSWICLVYLGLVGWFCLLLFAVVDDDDEREKPTEQAPFYTSR